MSVRRLRSEITMWRGVWQQLATFLDRIDETAELDEANATVICTLLPIMAVIERARKRAKGKGLSPALPCAPRGRKPDGTYLDSVTKDQIKPDRGRLPGVEDQEYAACMLKNMEEDRIKAENKKVEDPADREPIPPLDEDNAAAFLVGTATLFKYRDDEHGDVEVTIPRYEFGNLKTSTMVVFVEKVLEAGDGHFSWEKREKIVEEGSGEMTSWRTLRTSRLKKAEGDVDDTLSGRIEDLEIKDDTGELILIGADAATAASWCRYDAGVVGSSKTLDALVAADVSEDLINKLAPAQESLTNSAERYEEVAAKLADPAVYQLDAVGLEEVKRTLSLADRPSGGSSFSSRIDDLDDQAGSALDDAVEARLAYPDGTLRMLRLLEWTLRHQWGFREKWFDWRLRLVLGPLFYRAMLVFCESLRAIISGEPTAAPVNGGKVGRETTAQATSIPLVKKLDLSRLVPGHMAYIGGDRPAVALLLGYETKQGNPMSTHQLNVAPLNISVATDTKLPGLPGTLKTGSPISNQSNGVSQAELRAGKSKEGAQADAVPLEVVAIGSRLKLILGDEGGEWRPRPPSIAAPFPETERFGIEEPVEVGATRLFLKRVPDPAQSGSSRDIPMAREGEVLLIRGADSDGHWWQSVIIVGRVDTMTGAQARADDEATATTTPVCCEDDEMVTVITLRDMQIPHDLVRDVSISRKFDGFGPASLSAREMLPEELDPKTHTIRITDGDKEKTLRRDPELAAATRILDAWMQQGSTTNEQGERQ